MKDIKHIERCIINKNHFEKGLNIVKPFPTDLSKKVMIISYEDYIELEIPFYINEKKKLIKYLKRNMNIKSNSRLLIFTSKDMDIIMKPVYEEIHLFILPSLTKRFIMKERAKIKALKKCISILVKMFHNDF